MIDPILLAIDNGTQSVRALFFDLGGNLLEKVQIPLQSYYSERPGWAEQNPIYYWENLCKASRLLIENSKFPKGAIAGVAVTTQRGTVINVDEAGNALRPAMVWLDQRRTEGVKPVKGIWGLAFRLAGMRETAAYLQAEAEANWIQKHQPEVWAETHKFLFLSGYLAYKFTGQFVDSVASQVGYVPFDYKGLDWAKSWDWKWQAVPISKTLLPKLIPPGSVMGHVTAQAAQESGIPAGLPVVAAAADKACEVIGAGCLSPNIGCLSYGTTATINTTQTKYIEAIPLIPPYPAAVPGSYSLEIQVYRGFWMVSWFKDEFAHREQQIAEKRGIAPEDLFDELVNEVSPGSMGLVLQPYWSPGLKVPGPEAKGAIIGFGDVHTRAHMYRAILEGLAYALREGKERSEKRSGIKITELRVSGGGSQSDSAMQITADIFGLPTARPRLYETSGLGAAIDLAVGLKLHPDFDTAIQEMTRLGDVFEPDPRNRDIYDGLYHKVYKQMYRKLKPLYNQIREITGYPSGPV